MLCVYLAGAVRGGKGTWRNRIPDIPNVRFMHPGAAIPGGNEERRTDLYGPADRVAVRKCDIVLANCDRIEGGLGTAIEIGMALALGKEIFLVCPSEESRYIWRFAVGSTPTVYSSLEEALAVIRYAAGQVSGEARCAAP
ncbi:MAG: nucleoside 2-deoxyribosyltransferase [Phycisphaerae bacterium]